MIRGLKNHSSAFTLIELLVTISIIGVLASTIIAATANAKRKGQDAQIMSEANQVRNALELYASSNGGYPNPTPGTKGVWCIGGSGCALYSNGQQKYVSNQLSGLSMPDFNLPAVYHDGGYDQGIIYESCGDITEYCPSATTDDALNPDDPNGAAEIVYGTYSTGGGESFVGTWSNIYDTTYTPPAGALTVTADIYVTYKGVTYGLGTKNNTYNKIIPAGDTFTVTWASTNANTPNACTILGTNTNWMFTPSSGSENITYSAPKSFSISCNSLNGSDNDSITIPQAK